MADNDSERGKPATFDPGTGEDYDQDPMAGAGAEPPHGPRTADDSARRPIDPDEGI
jgi:hypothetical protein